MKSTTVAGLILSIFGVIHIGDAAAINCPGGYPCDTFDNRGCNITEAEFTASCNGQDVLLAIGRTEGKSGNREPRSMNNSSKNISMQVWTVGNFNVTPSMFSQIYSWWSKDNNTNMSAVNSYTATQSKVNKNFGMLATDRNTAVGCGLISFKTNETHTVNELICNYAID